MSTMNRKQKTSQQISDIKKSKSGNAVQQIHHDTALSQMSRFKRHGDNLTDPNQKRRAAFGDITNALNEKTQKKKEEKKTKLPLPGKVKVLQEGKPSQTKDVSKTKKKVKKVQPEEELDENVIQLSQGSVISSSQESTSSHELTSSQESLNSTSSSDLNTANNVTEEEVRVPEDVDDVDKENLKDIAQVALYASFIFTYYKERELKFMVPMYMDTQPSLTTNMRGILVDWLVEVQENFELNHETLYLAVKLVDTYLSKQIVSKEGLQLVGAAALFISCKFDERCPPLVEDFLYICDDAYDKNEFLAMERSILKTVGFDIGMPLSYRFLRRYAKCARASMEILTLARFILESSLMDYDFLKYRESKMASACLLLAMKMKKSGTWTTTMDYYTGYNESDLLPVMKELNTMVANPPKQLTTVRSKYSHSVFYEVAKTPALPGDELIS